MTYPVVALPQFGDPQTDAEIITNAGIICGQFNVLLNETGNRFAQSATALYGTILYAELGSSRWRFAQSTKQISIYTNITPDHQFDGWQYEAALPGDYLMLLSPYPIVPYTVWGNRILTTGTSPIIIKYMRYVPVSMWNPTFKMFMTYQLAEHMAMSVCPPDKTAQITKMRQHWESRAQFADGQSVPGQPFLRNPWWNARFEGGGGDL